MFHNAYIKKIRNVAHHFLGNIWESHKCWMLDYVTGYVFLAKIWLVSLKNNEYFCMDKSFKLYYNLINFIKINMFYTILLIFHMIHKCKNACPRGYYCASLIRAWNILCISAYSIFQGFHEFHDTSMWLMVHSVDFNSEKEVGCEELLGWKFKCWCSILPYFGNSSAGGVALVCGYIFSFLCNFLIHLILLQCQFPFNEISFNVNIFLLSQQFHSTTIHFFHLMLIFSFFIRIYSTLILIRSPA